MNTTSQPDHQPLAPPPFKPSSALDVDQDRTLEHLERATPVRLIGTFHELVTTHVDEPIRVAVAKAEPYGFNYLPMCETTSGTIIGLFITKATNLNGKTVVGEVMEPLSGRNLIAADTPLLHFIYDADTCPCRLILDGAQITGLVTISDIQKLPVRTALFSLFIHLEVLLTEHLRRRLDGANPFEMLSPGREQEASEKWESFKQGNMEQDRLLALDFCDKKTVLKKCGGIEMSSSRIEREFSTIEKKLRNPIAHGADYALSQEAAVLTAQTARVVRNWIALLCHQLASA